jgi:membrane protein CcdC involved in cytochrome C biogenesis
MGKIALALVLGDIFSLVLIWTSYYNPITTQRVGFAYHVSLERVQMVITILGEHLWEKPSIY